ncbi:protein unc-45 homolog A [Pterocles gutturalis]
MKTMSCTDSKVEQMFQILLNPEQKDADKKQKAAQNLIVLAREEAGAEKIFQSDGVRLLTQLLDTAKADLMLAALRTLVGLCSGHRSRTMAILAELGAPRLSAVLGVEHEQVSLAAYNLLHVMFDSLKEGLQKDFRGKEDAVVPDSAKDLKVLIKHLLELLALEGASAHGRDNALNLLIKVVPRKSPKETNNSMSLWVIDQGLKKILEVGSTVCGAPGSLPVTENSRMSASVLLSKLFDDLKCDAERENFHHLCEDYVRSWFEGQELAGKLRAIQTVSCLLQGPADAGNRVLELEGIMDGVLSLCASVCEVHQLVAVEALIHAADKAKRASFITANGVSLLKEIYKHSERDSIRIRALVIYEVVRPLVSLLHLQRTGLENFEGLMALTNLAGISERLRQKILKEKAVPMIEGYMFEEHQLIRLAATECMCNMAMSKEVQELFLAEGSDRLKLMVLYSGEEDEKLRRAASGTLAMLTALHPPICKRITQVTVHWLEILQALLLSPSAELQHRGAVVVMNMMAAEREVAEQLMASAMLEILSVLAKDKDKLRVAQAAKESLAQAVAYGLIKPNPGQE